MKGIVVENSLRDQSILNRINVVRSWEDEDWKLHEVDVSKEQAEEFSKYLNDDPWYVHFWEPDSDDILVIFKNKIFTIKHSQKETWADAVEYGKSLGIPEEQLDFIVG